jgi:hypothetical protein
MSEKKKISNIFALLKKDRRNADPGSTGSSTGSHSPLPGDRAAHLKAKSISHSSPRNVRGGVEVEVARSGAGSGLAHTHSPANIVGGQSIPRTIPVVFDY